MGIRLCKHCRIWVILLSWMIGVPWVKALVTLVLILFIRTLSGNEIQEGMRTFFSAGMRL